MWHNRKEFHLINDGDVLWSSIGTCNAYVILQQKIYVSLFYVSGAVDSQRDSCQKCQSEKICN